MTVSHFSRSLVLGFACGGELEKTRDPSSGGNCSCGGAGEGESEYEMI